MRFLLLLLIVFSFTSQDLCAQSNEILKEGIYTLSVRRNGEWNSIPYLNLGTRDKLLISFDDLTHEYHRYRYRVEPMTWDWKVNERLLSSEFLSRGIGDESIDDYEESINTTVDYTHYNFTFPDANTAIRLSGNYRLVVYDDDEDEDVLIIPFYVVENNAVVSANVTTDTDVDFNKSYQQLTMKLQPQASLSVHYPETELHTIVMQNMQAKNIVRDPKPDYVNSNGLEWVHSPKLVFPAGNEFLKFEMTTLRFGGMRMESVKWFDPYYHASIVEDSKLANYVYDEDRNGAFVIKDIDNTDDEIQADYVLVHFFLKAPRQTDGDIYIYGGFSNYELSDKYMMKYNELSGCYENALLMKLGYYNYQYLFLSSKESSTAESAYSPTRNMISGNFYQTENRYTVFAYYSQRGSRYDRLIAINDFQYMPSRR